MVDVLLQTLVFLTGAFIVISTIQAAIRSFVLPRNEAVLISNVVFALSRYLFDAVAALGRSFRQRDRVMALFAPVSLVALPIVWLGLVSAGYTLMFWALGEGDWWWCYKLSNNALLTLGSEKSDNVWSSALSYSEAALGLLLMTLLISYLPTIYQAFSKRELTVARLELRAGSGHSSVRLIQWLNRTGSLHDDAEQWLDWEEWFTELEESHTSLPIISFFRSPQPGRSWITAAGLILETAALIKSSITQPHDPHMELCFEAGCQSLTRIWRFFQVRMQATPPVLVKHPDPVEDPTYQAFRRARTELAEAGIAVTADEKTAWEEFQQLRSRYHEALDFLARLTMAPDLHSVDNQEDKSDRKDPVRDQQK